MATSNKTDLNKSNLVVNIDQDCDDNLQELFASVLQPGDSNRPLQVPFRMRKLPESFFNPPQTGSKSPSVSHSRENSADSAFGSGSTVMGVTGPSIVNRLPISHSRAHSSPASLQQTYAALNSQNNNNNQTTNNAQQQVQQQQQQVQQAQQQQPNKLVQHVHMKQRSYDVISNIQLQKEYGDLPPGWEQAKTQEGQIYYLKYVVFFLCVVFFYYRR